jgi:hypothetical protein
MKIHKRELEAKKAETQILCAVENYISSVGEFSYMDIYYIWNEIERFWIDAGRHDMSEREATLKWSDHPLASDPLMSAVKGVGNIFNVAVAEYELTYGEIVRIIGTEKLSLAKYHIRYERHPEDPDKPGGVE